MTLDQAPAGAQVFRGLQYPRLSFPASPRLRSHVPSIHRTHRATGHRGRYFHQPSGRGRSSFDGHRGRHLARLGRRQSIEPPQAATKRCATTHPLPDSRRGSSPIQDPGGHGPCRSGPNGSDPLPAAWPVDERRADLGIDATSWFYPPRQPRFPLRQRAGAHSLRSGLTPDPCFPHLNLIRVAQ